MPTSRCKLHHALLIKAMRGPRLESHLWQSPSASNSMRELGPVRQSLRQPDSAHYKECRFQEMTVTIKSAPLECV